MEDSPGIALIVALLLLIYAIVTFLLPFFVLRIRNEMISMNQKMSQLIKLLGGKEQFAAKSQYVDKMEMDHKGRKIKICQHCGAKNRPQDYNCVRCSKPLL
ncbi:MAG: hypothetical protein K9J85_11775 [Desulfobacteraceae bacterium]|nr:hypothetical protein [Desulfobacteraceae bacterium]